MDLLNRITIRNRMIIAFSLVVSLFVAFGVVAISQMGVLSDLTSALYEHPLRVSNAAVNASLDVIKMHRSMKDVAMSTSELELQNAIQAVRESEEDVYRHLDVVRTQILGAEGKNLERETRKVFADWKQIRDGVLDLVVKGDREAASLITKGKGADHVALLERRMTELTAYARNKADGFMADAEEVRNKVVGTTIMFVLTAVLLSLITVYLVVSSILSSVSSLRSTMSRIAGSGELMTSDVAGSNEITEMSRHFNWVIERLQNLFWLRDGQNALNSELSGEQTYDEIAERSINFVSRHVNACIGALYSLDENRSLCSLTASFAFTESKHIASVFKLGEGIVGQVAAEGRAILLDSIAREDAVGRSGTMVEPPRSIYAMPLIHEEKLHGVLEVASFDSIDDTKREFLDSVSRTISADLYTASQRDQIRRLLEAAQQANERLQAQTEELQAMNQEIQKQAEELQEQNVELETQRKQVEAASQLKSEFLSNMSHELRTPLNSVMALSRVLLMQSGNKLSDEETGYLEIIERNGKQLLALINDILDLSKIEAGRMDITPTVFSIGSVIDAIIESLSPIAQEKEVELLQEIPDDLPAIESDETRVHQILQNIIGNGVKFTRRGRVTVTATHEQQEMRIAVRDTGIGISQADLPHIFDEFRQVDGSSSREFEGTGLGLAIAGKAAKMLGGSISVESVSGMGTVFHVILPVRWTGAGEPNGTHRAATATAPDTLRGGTELGVDFANGGGIRESRRILLVEDNASAVIQVSKALETVGIVVDVAADGEDALQYMKNTIPDGIVLDLMMPGVDGFEVLETIKNSERTASIPVLVLTARDLTSDDLRKLRANGIHELIQKGDVDRQELLSAVITMIGLTVGTESQDALDEDLETTVQPMPQADPAGADGEHRPTILVIEDNRDNMVAIKAVLGDTFDLLEAVDGIVGLERTVAEQPALVILDMSLPGMDGFEVARQIKASKRTRHIPVLALTAHAMAGDRDRAIAAGCDDYATKPVDPEEILKKIDKWLGKEQSFGENTGD